MKQLVVISEQKKNKNKNCVQNIPRQPRIINIVRMGLEKYA